MYDEREQGDESMRLKKEGGSFVIVSVGRNVWVVGVRICWIPCVLCYHVV